MTTPRGDRLEAIVQPLIRPMRGEENLSRLERRLNRIHRSTQAVNRELGTLNRISTQFASGAYFDQRSGRFRDSTTGRFARNPYRAHADDPQNQLAQRFGRQESTRSSLLASRKIRDDQATRRAFGQEQRFVDTSQEQEALRLSKERQASTQLRGQSMMRNNQIGDQALAIERQHVMETNKLARAEQQRIAQDTADLKALTRQRLADRQTQIDAQEKINRAKRREMLASQRISKIHEMNNNLLKKQGIFSRRNWRTERQRQQIIRRTMWALNQNVGLTRKLGLVTHGVASGAFRISSLFRGLPPRIKVAVKLLLGMALVIGGMAFGLFMAVRAVQQLTSEAARAGTTVASAYRSAAAGAVIGLPIREGTQLTGALAAEAASNLASVVSNAKQIEKVNKVLQGIGSTLTFRTLIDMDRRELERTIINELLRLENTIKNRGRRITAQTAFLQDVVGLSEFDEAFPLMSAFRRGEGGNVLKAWQEAQPLMDETYNRAVRLAGQFERIMFAMINFGGAVGSALEPLLGPILGSIVLKLENLALWLERNPELIRNWLRGFMFYAEPFLRLLDLVVFVLTIIFFLLNSIIWATGKLLNLLPGDKPLLTGSFTGAFLSVLPPFQDQDSNSNEESRRRQNVEDARERPTDMRSIINNYHSVSSEDEFNIYGASDPEASADAASERDRIQFQMHGIR